MARTRGKPVNKNVSYIGIFYPLYTFIPDYEEDDDMVTEGKEAIFFQPWLIILPGIALFLLVISINMLGDGLRDITDPASKQDN